MSQKSLSLEQIKKQSQQAYARISNKICYTPLIKSNVYGDDLFFKAENFQYSGSFKLRGAFSKLTALSDLSKLDGSRLITASSGNHGLACSYAAVSYTHLTLPTIYSV